MEAYETRVAENEKKKLMAPIPLDEEIKAKVSSPKRNWGASWIQQYTILFRRGIKEHRHDYFSWLRITQVLATAVILGLLWWQSDSKSPKGLEDQVHNLFCWSIQLSSPIGLLDTKRVKKCKLKKKKKKKILLGIFYF